MDPPIDAVDDDADPVAEFVGELLVDHAARRLGVVPLLAVEDEACRAALLAPFGERPVDRFDDIAALAERPHGRLELIRDVHTPGSSLPGEPIALKGLQAADPQRPSKSPRTWPASGRRSSTRSWASASIARSIRVKRSAETSASSFVAELPVGLRTELQRCVLLGAQPHAVGDVVLGDDEVLAQVVAAADDDVAVRMAGVEMVDGDPIELGAEILLHLPHYVAGEGAEVRESVTILRGDDEAELVAVFPAAFDEGRAVRSVGVGAIEPPALAVARRAVALQVADVGIGRLAADLEPHDPGLDHDPAHPLPGPALRCRPLEPIAAAWPRPIRRAPSLPGPLWRDPAASLAPHLGECQRAAVGLGGGPHGLSHEGLGIASTAAAMANATGSGHGSRRRRHASSLGRLRRPPDRSSSNHDTSHYSDEILALFGEARLVPSQLCPCEGCR